MKSNLEYYLKLNPNIKKMRIVRMVNQMGFCKRNKKKVNVVAFQLKTQSAIALGKVEGDYEFRDNSNYKTYQAGKMVKDDS